MQRILVIQTASIGDVILATSILEKLNEAFPGSEIDILVKKGIDTLFIDHPFIKRIYSWDKKKKKIKNLYKILKEVRSRKYDLVINIQRFGLTGLLVALSRAGRKVGFDKNPFSFFYDKKVKHIIGEKNVHEIERNHVLIRGLTDDKSGKVRLYPAPSDIEAVKKYTSEPFITVSPASLWYTKQFPINKWVEFLKGVSQDMKIYLTGGPADIKFCKDIAELSGHENCYLLSGKLSLLQTAALMKNAEMNFVNDSAPQHLASAMNAKTTAIFCSTVPEFGFGPLSDDSEVVETEKKLECRPCGLHGHKACPEKHFECAMSISKQKLLDRIDNG